MTMLSKPVLGLLGGALLATQSGCVTSALLKWGEGSDPYIPRTEQPVAYTGAARSNRYLELEYTTTVDSDGNVQTRAPTSFRVDLGALSWRPAGPAPMDPYCASEAWYRLLPSAPPQPPAPLILRRPTDMNAIIGMHKQYATGFPALSVQTSGIDTLVVCGSGDAIGYAQAPTPPEPQEGQEGGRKAGYIVGIALLFPFALAVDIAGGLIYVAACIGGNSHC